MMQTQINSIVVAMLLLSIASAFPNYILAQNISIGDRVDALTFISDDTLVTGRSDGKVKIFEFNGSQFS